jgi:CBS domain-containing protein
MGMKVRDVMTKHPICATQDITLEAVACLMVDCDCGAIPVVGDQLTKLPIGMVTDRDIVSRAVAAGRSHRDTVVGDIMTAPAFTITEDSDLEHCIALMEERQIRRVIVVDKRGSASGIVAQADIAAHASKRLTGELLEQVSRPTADTTAEAHRFVRMHE